MEAEKNGESYFCEGFGVIRWTDILSPFGYRGGVFALVLGSFVADVFQDVVVVENLGAGV